MRTIKTYDELISIPTFEGRLEYLMEGSKPGVETFGPNRWINQQFYESRNWKIPRREVILRDRGMDLGVDGYVIDGAIYVHHLNPITIYDIINLTPFAIDPKYLISMSLDTHNMIHYGIKGEAPMYPVERTPNDTCPWRR